MRSSEQRTAMTDGDERVLVDVAYRSIESAIRVGVPLDVRVEDFVEALRAPAASFVTVEREGDLLGCVGSIRARMPLVRDVAHNAFGAIVHDPRCPTLRPSDVPNLDVHISILSEPEPMAFASEEDLVRQLRPGIDGLILEEGFRRGTFLPVVWESLPNPRDFLRHLKAKAGLPPSYWSGTLRVSRYTTSVVHGGEPRRRR